MGAGTGGLGGWWQHEGAACPAALRASRRSHHHRCCHRLAVCPLRPEQALPAAPSWSLPAPSSHSQVVVSPTPTPGTLRALRLFSSHCSRCSDLAIPRTPGHSPGTGCVWLISVHSAQLSRDTPARRGGTAPEHLRAGTRCAGGGREERRGGGEFLIP